MGLDRQTPVPLYYQVSQILEQRILAGEWMPGHKIPTESILVEEFQVSRQTVRQALEDLVRKDLLYRQAGRGTFVKSPKSAYELSSLCSFTEQMKARGLEPSSHLVSLTREVAGGVAKTMLGAPDNEPIWRLERLRLADNEPMALEIMYLPVRFLPDLEKRDFATLSVYGAVEELGYKIEGAHQTLEAENCTEEVAAMLRVNPGAAVLHMREITYLKNQQPLCYVECYYRGDRYVFSASMPRK